ncbi:MAG: hypothetical protein GY731_00490 [Gammaproteobacteria bacterium]|nr:hypothetical protein [Gammaproteobacteria bacterium]
MHLFGIALFAVYVFCIVAYWPGLQGPMMLDDHPQFASLFEAAERGVEPLGGYLISDSGPLGRPVAMASFLANAMSAGDRMVYWKFTNLMLHLITGLLVFLLSRRLIGWVRKGSEGRPAWMALLIGGMWLLHPLHVSTVLYTVQRMTELSALFVFAGLLSYVHGRCRQVHGAKGMHWVALAFVLFLPLAAFSKENGLLLPLLAFLIELFLFRFRGSRFERRVLTGFFLAFLLLPLLLASVVLVWRFEELILAGYEGRAFSLEQRGMTQFRVVLFYLYLLLVPVQRNMGFFHDDFPLSFGWLTPPDTLLALLVCLALIGFAWRMRDRSPLVGLGILFFFGAHLMESTIYPLELAFEHRNYLPSFGVFLSLIGAVERLLDSRLMRIWIPVGIISLLIILTWIRAGTWSARSSLYEYAYISHPSSHRARAELSQYLTEKGRYPEALAILDSRQGSAPMLHRLYIHCLLSRSLKVKDLARVEGVLHSPIDNYTVTGLIEIARMGLDNNCRFSHSDYLSLLNRAVALKVTDIKSAYKLWLYKAQYHWELGDEDGGITALMRSNQLVPDNPVPYYLAAEWMLEKDNLVLAKEYYHRANRIAAGSRFSFNEIQVRIRNSIEELERVGLVR